MEDIKKRIKINKKTVSKQNKDMKKGLNKTCRN